MVSNDYDNYSSMEDLSEQDLSPRRYQRGEVVEGEVVRVDDDGIVVSIGLKTEGIVPPQEMRTLAQEDKGRFAAGRQRDGYRQGWTRPRRHGPPLR